jgi:diacylglycerol kinase (ATP)
VADGRTTLLPRGPLGIWKALRWSLRGLRLAFQTESSFRLEVYLLLLFAPLAVVLGRTGPERALLFGSLLLVLLTELLNSAIECVIDKLIPEFHELAGRAKDMGSAAVFVSMVAMLATWAFILWPRFA